MIRFFNVSMQYGENKALDDISFKIDKGEFVYMIGPSGSGKTSLLKMIYMEEFPSEGSVSVEEFDTISIKKWHIHKLRRKLGIVFQDFKLLTDRSVYDNIAFVLKVTGSRKKEIRRKVERALDQVGLIDKIDKKPNELSGGQRQRVAIARALVNNPSILLADEPTGNLDSEMGQEVMDILMDLNKNEGITIVMVTHDETHARYTQRIIKVFDGKVINVVYDQVSN